MRAPYTLSLATKPAAVDATLKVKPDLNRQSQLEQLMESGSAVTAGRD